MYKDGQTFCLDLFISSLHKIGELFDFIFFVLLCKLPESYENKWFHVYCASGF